jgi:hypothetical protein
MRCKTAPQSVVASREERVAKLTAFIAHHLSSAAYTPGAPISFIARSLDSPVARAVETAIAQSGKAIPVRALLASVERKSLEDQGIAWTTRVLSMPRLLDAHEQLSVGRACWHGDCLKRDPNKRDAFEHFHDPHSEMPAWIEISFARLWAMAKPVVSMRETITAATSGEIPLIAGESVGSTDPQQREPLQR